MNNHPIRIMMNKNNLHRQVAEVIRIERLKKGYSQEYIALQLNISQNAYSRIERGVTKLDIERLHSIATLLEVNMHIFFPEMSK